MRSVLAFFILRSKPHTNTPVSSGWQVNLLSVLLSHFSKLPFSLVVQIIAFLLRLVLSYSEVPLVEFEAFSVVLVLLFVIEILD